MEEGFLVENRVLAVISIKMKIFGSLLLLTVCFVLYIGFKWYLASEETQIINPNVTIAFQEPQISNSNVIDVFHEPQKIDSVVSEAFQDTQVDNYNAKNDIQLVQTIHSNVTHIFQESLTIEKVVSRISDCPSYFESLRNMIFQGFQANLTRYVV